MEVLEQEGAFYGVEYRVQAVRQSPTAKWECVALVNGKLYESSEESFDTAKAAFAAGHAEAKARARSPT